MTYAAQTKDGESDMFFLEWQTMPLDSLLPRYAEVIPLDGNHSELRYQVSLLYPEWKEMTSAESLCMAQWADSITHELRINTHVGTMRGKAFLDVDFIPVVIRDGKYYKLLSAKMEIEGKRSGEFDGSDDAFSLSRQTKQRKAAEVKDRYTRTSKLAQGQWVKISITEDGMYRLTSSALQKMGFKNPQNVHLYGHGGHRLSQVSSPENEYDDLQEVPLYQAGKDTWLFWGDGLVYWDGNTRIFNPYANEACYFLTEEDAPSKIETIESVSASSGTPITSFTDHILYEKDNFSYVDYGRNLFDAVSFKSSNSHTYKLATPIESLGDEKLTVVFTAANNTATTLTTTVNGNALSNIKIDMLGDHQHGVSKSTTFDVNKYKNGKEWTIKLTSTSGNEGHLDYLALHYTRPITPQQSFVAFQGNSSGATSFQIQHDGSWCEVMRISKPGQPAVLINGKSESGKYTFSVAKGDDRFVCFNTSFAYPQPTVVGKIENQNLHALDSLDMVIIIPESGKLETQAARLAQAHKVYDGLKTAIVRADQIYNEFSSGTPDATAYRRLVKMLYDRAGGDENVMPRYLLLMGDCCFDNRMLTSAWSRKNPKDYLLCFESENSFSSTLSYVMEDYFGLLDDGEGASLTRDKVDLGVGRFPVTTDEEARYMVDKSIDFISNKEAGAWKNVVMMLGDDGDDNSHMRYADDVAERIIKRNPEMEVKKVMWDAYTRVSNLSENSYPEVTATIRNQLNEGAMVMNYMGHGAPYVLSHEKAWYGDDFKTFKGDRLPLWFIAACDITPFDGAIDNMGETAVVNEHGGALAFVSTTRTVYASNNANLNRYYMQYLFGNDSQGRRLRLGDAHRLTKVSLVGTEMSNLENKLQYCILGDPALTIGAPLNRVKLDAITDAMTGAKVEKLKAGMAVKLEGHLENDKQENLNGFTGVVSVRVYDSLDEIVCKRNDVTLSNAFTFTDRGSVLFAGQDSVRNGQFTLSFVVPKDIKYSDGEGRMVFYAISDERDVEANGYNEDFLVGGTAESADSNGPKIEMMLNGEYGGTVNSTPYLVARLTDESGINAVGSGVGHDILLTIDNNPAWTYVLNENYVQDFGDYTQGSLAFTIPTLPAGSHTLSLRVWDMLNNTNVAYMDFNVDPNYTPSILHLAASPVIAKEQTTFLLTYDLPGTDCEYTIEVFDYAGRRLWQHEGMGKSNSGTFAVPWNLSVGSGYGRISPGIYIYRASLKCGDSKLVTQSHKLIVN